MFASCDQTTRLTAASQLPLPTLLRPPPGLEAFGPGYGKALGRYEQPVAEKQEGCQESDACGSECSTAESAEVRSSTSAAGGYHPGQVLQSTAALALSTSGQALPDGFCISGECPSIGSAGHAFGLCKPCDFMHRTSCRSGAACNFCHLCGPGENRRRKKQRQALNRMMKSSAAKTAPPCRTLLLDQLVR